jgi:hypothetical protein
MNDPLLLTTKLDELVKLANEASTAFEKSAVYAATQSILAEFNSEEPEFDSYTLEKVHNASWSIKAAIDYDITNGHSKSQHISWAYGELSTLRNLLKERLGVES